MANDKVKILYIAGAGRSGSTLIDMLLGKIAGFTSFGELRFIWYRSFSQNQLTGDDHPFKESPFWNEVVQEAYGGFDKIDPDYMMELRRKVDRFRYIPQLARPKSRTESFIKDFSEYSSYLVPLYSAMQKVSGCELIIDSSKDSPYGYILNAIPEFDVHVLHLVRDSRAVAYSWQRKKVRPEIHWEEQYMPQFSILRSSRLWNNSNLACEGFRFINKKYAFMRYEDFTKAPFEITRKALDFFGFQDKAIDFLSENKFQPVVSPSVSGNPLRFQKDEVVIKSDIEWSKNMPKSQQLMIAALTSPLMAGYGYLLNLPGRKSILHRINR